MAVDIVIRLGTRLRGFGFESSGEYEETRLAYWRVFIRLRRWLEYPIGLGAYHNPVHKKFTWQL